jgi:uncharacterized protein YraI
MGLGGAMSAPGNVKTSYEIRAGLDEEFAATCAGQRRIFSWIAEGERHGIWQADGCRDMAQWVAGRMGMSYWAASRWINAALALDKLPALSEAFSNGALGVDKVVELTRFATPKTEKELITWARKVNPATIRRRADVANRPSIEDHQDAHNSRYLDYWLDDLMLRFEGALPAEAGAKFVKAVNRIADGLPKAPTGSEDKIDCSIEARRADALVALASATIADDQDPDRATVVVHVDLESLGDVARGGEIESGGTLHPEIIRRLGCGGDIEWVLGDGNGKAVGIGQRSRQIPKWMERELRYRDGGCTFPGCGTKRFVSGHHIFPWPGPTDLDNVTLVCDFHHRLIHEYKWKVALNDTGRSEWFRPDGTRYDPAPKGRQVEDRGPPTKDFV